MAATIDTVLSIICIVAFVLLFFRSTQICFLPEKKLAPILITIFLNPWTIVNASNTVAAICLGSIGGIPGGEIGLTIILSAFLIAFVLVAMVIYTKLVKPHNNSMAVFVYLMLTTLYFTMLIPPDNSVASKGMIYLFINYAFEVILLAIMAFLYIRLIKPLSILTQEKQEINWRVFVLVPGLVSLCSAVLSSHFAAKDYTEPYEHSMIKFTLCSVLLVVLIISFSVMIENIRHIKMETEAKTAIKTLSVEVMEALAHTIDAKDEYTRGHSVRVAKYSRMLAEKMGQTPEECENVYYMGLLHDIGKIGVPNAIINSTTRLSDEEFNIIKTHPGLGYDILNEIKSRPDLAIGARWHHERYDGRGYPDGKAGEDIPFPARLIAVADSYDAMTSNRSYRQYLPQDVVREEIEKNSGTQFDPDCAKAWLEIMDEDTEYVLHE